MHWLRDLADALDGPRAVAAGSGSGVLLGGALSALLGFPPAAATITVLVAAGVLTAVVWALRNEASKLEDEEPQRGTATSVPAAPPPRPAAPAWNWRTVYAAGDVVSHEGLEYVVAAEHQSTKAITPPNDLDNWRRVEP